MPRREVCARAGVAPSPNGFGRDRSARFAERGILARVRRLASVCVRVCVCECSLLHHLPAISPLSRREKVVGKYRVAK